MTRPPRIAGYRVSADVAALNAEQVEDATRAAGPNKYRNEPTVVDGIRFDSKREARRWGELTLLQDAGLISDLARQVWFDLYGGVRMRLDFTYTENGRQVAEDAKGYATRAWLDKAKQFRVRHPEWELRTS